MKTYRAFFLVLFIILTLSFYATPIYAAPSQQADDPVRQCSEGHELFLQGKYSEALPLLEAGFSGREKVNFADPEGLGYCAMVLGLLRNSIGDTNGALEAYQVALQIFQLTRNRKFEAIILNNIGVVYESQSQYTKALEYYRQTLTIRREVGDREGEGVTFSNIGAVYYAQGQYAQALEYYQQALIIAQEIDDKKSEGKTLNNFGSVYYAQGQYAQALEYYLKALIVVQDVGDQASEGRTLNNLGTVDHAQGQYVQALGYYQKALSIFREIDDKAGEGTTLTNIGEAYAKQGQYGQALDYYQQALLIHREGGHRANEGVTLNNLGTVYGNRGQYSQALEHFQQALSIQREVGDRAGEGTTLNNIGEVYNSQGQFAQTIDYHQQALAIHREVGNQAGEGRTLNYLGAVCQTQGQYIQALDYYQQALVIIRETGEQASEGTILNNLGSLYYAQGQYVQALNYHQQALVIVRAVGDLASEGITLNNLGTVYYAQGQYMQALDYYQKALLIHREVGDREGESKTLNNIGEAYYSQGQYTQALEYYQQAISVLEKLRAVAGNDAARTSFISQYEVVYQNSVFVAHQLQQDQQAFSFSEQGRARSFLDALTTGTMELSDQSAAELITREQETYDGWLAAQEALAKAKAQNPPNPNLIGDLETQLADAEQAHTGALQAIEARDDELAALVPGRSTVLSLDEVQTLLDDQTTLISYFVIDDDSGALAFLITRDSFSVVELPDAKPGNLKTAVEQLTPSLQDTHPQPLQDLYNWLIPPLKDQIKTPRVGIIPHLTLHYVPFAALTDGQTYLSEQYQLFELPSASSLRYIQQHAAEITNSGAVVFGNPTTNETGLPVLPYAAAEANAVAATLGVSDYTGTTATELQLHESVSGKAVLHLAVHGSYNQYNPLSSTLYLAPDTGGQYDGRLEVHEIFGLNLKGSQLVVLSACETQLGQLSTGDEVVGMTRAFMFAGTPSVLASLWQVDDEATQVLMTSFYKHWRQDGMNKAQALQAAQADVRANPNWQSPYYWAAFVLNGDVGTTPIQPMNEITTETAPTSNPSSPICPNTVLAPVALIALAFTTKRRPRSS